MQSKNIRSAAVGFYLFVICFLGASPSSAQNPFYQDKNINVVAATDAGGTADLRIRTVVAFLASIFRGIPTSLLSTCLGVAGARLPITCIELRARMV